MRQYYLAAVLSAAMLAALPVSARADDTTFMGIHLGAPAPAECPTETRSFGGPSYRPTAASYPCWSTLGGRPDGKGLQSQGLQTVEMWVSSESQPNGTHMPYVDIFDGKVESISVVTNGFSVQDSLLESLTKKYGKPIDLKRDPVQTGAGAKFDRIHAVWLKPNLHVEFFGMLSTIAEGSISVRTDAAQARFKERYGGEKSF